MACIFYRRDAGGRLDKMSRLQTGRRSGIVYTLVLVVDYRIFQDRKSHAPGLPLSALFINGRKLCCQRGADSSYHHCLIFPHCHRLAAAASGYGDVVVLTVGDLHLFD